MVLSSKIFITTSMLIIGMVSACTGPSHKHQVRFFTDVDGKGDAWTTTFEMCGNSPSDCMNVPNEYNDRFSSFTVLAGSRLNCRIYEHADCKGNSRMVDRQAGEKPENFSLDMNDKMTSYYCKLQQDVPNK